MTKWTKEPVVIGGLYLVAVKDAEFPWDYSVWSRKAGYVLPDNVWRSVDPITPPSEERT